MYSLERVLRCLLSHQDHTDLEKEIRRMSLALDSLAAEVARNSAAVDALIARMGGVPEADVQAQADALAAINDRAEAAQA